MEVRDEKALMAEKRGGDGARRGRCENYNMAFFILWIMMGNWTPSIGQPEIYQPIH